MMVLSNDITRIGFECTIHKFVVVGILCYQIKMKINLHLKAIGKVEKCRYYIACYLGSQLLSKDFLILH